MDKSLVIDDTRRKTFCSKGENQQQINSTNACMASSLPRYQPGPHFLCQPLFLFPLKPTYTPKKPHFNITQVSLYFIFYAFKLSTWQGLIQLNISFFFPAFPRLLFQRCCGLALSSNTRSQSSSRAAAQTLLRYISAIPYKEKMYLIPVESSL